MSCIRVLGRFEPFCQQHFRKFGKVGKTDYELIHNSETHHDEEISVFDSRHVVWSRGGCLIQTHDTAHQRSPTVLYTQSPDAESAAHTTELPAVSQAAIARFCTDDARERRNYDTHTNDCERFLCLLRPESIDVYSRGGAAHNIALPCRVRRIWPLRRGLLLERLVDVDTEPIALLQPTLLSITTHPLDETRPVALHTAPINSNNTNSDSERESTETLFARPYETIVHIDADFSIAVCYDESAQMHSVYRISWRPASETGKGGGGGGVQPNRLDSEIVMQRIEITGDYGSLRGRRASSAAVYKDLEGNIVLLLQHRHTETVHAFRIQGLDDDERPQQPLALQPLFELRARSVCCVRAFERRALCLVLAIDGSLALFSGTMKLCQFAFRLAVASPRSNAASSAIEIVELRDAVDDRVNLVLSSGALYRVRLSLDASNEAVRSALGALYRTLPTRLFVQLLRDYTEITANYGLAEWSVFSTICLVLAGCSPEPTSPAFGKLHTDHAAFQMYLPVVLLTLHLLYEDRKLRGKMTSVMAAEAPLISRLLHALSSVLGWKLYIDYYQREQPLLAAEPKRVSTPRNVDARVVDWVAERILFAREWLLSQRPPRILQWLLDSLALTSHYDDSSSSSDSIAPKRRIVPFPIIRDSPATELTRKICYFYDLLAPLPCGIHNEAATAMQSLYSAPIASTQSVPPPQCDPKRSERQQLRPLRTSYARVVVGMVQEKFTLADLESLTLGVAIPMREALAVCRADPPPFGAADWPVEAYALIGREDLLRLSLSAADSSNAAVPPVILDDDDDDANADEQDDRNVSGVGGGVSRLVFSKDKRLTEAWKMLDSSRAIRVHGVDAAAGVSPEQQQRILRACQRVLAVTVGRGMVSLATRSAEPTDALQIPAIVLAARLRKSRAVINLDMTNLAPDSTRWPEFHNGVAVGLSIKPHPQQHSSQQQQQQQQQQQHRPFEGVGRDWITYHRPETPTHSHAGMLLAFGLQGHLAALRATDIYHILTQRHVTTMVALLLGLAACKRGSQDIALTRTLSLHIVSLVPSPEVDVPIDVQTAALVALGLLYQGSCRRFMVELLLGELARLPDDHCAADRESYALAAGIALGLVSLAAGTASSPPPALVHLHLEESLYRYMAGGKRPKSDPLFSARNAGDASQPQPPLSAKIQESDTFVNVDVTGPGAAMALTLMYLQSNNAAIAKQLAVPETRYLLAYVKPDMLVLRALGSSLVMWDDIDCSEQWIRSRIPDVVHDSLQDAFAAADEDDDDEVEEDARVMRGIYAHIVAGCCLALGLRYAGSANEEAARIVQRYVDCFEASRLPDPIGHIEKQIADWCTLICILGLACIMAGTGDVATMRYIRRLQRVHEGSYGAQMALSMALGLLFLGAGCYSLSTSPPAIAALLIALYPRFPQSPTDGQYHFQPLRHLYVLAAEQRLLQVRDVDTGSLCPVPVHITYFTQQRQNRPQPTITATTATATATATTSTVIDHSAHSQLKTPAAASLQSATLAVTPLSAQNARFRHLHLNSGYSADGTETPPLSIVKVTTTTPSLMMTPSSSVSATPPASSRKSQAASALAVDRRSSLSSLAGLPANLVLLKTPPPFTPPGTAASSMLRGHTPSPTAANGSSPQQNTTNLSASKSDRMMTSPVITAATPVRNATAASATTTPISSLRSPTSTGAVARLNVDIAIVDVSKAAPCLLPEMRSILELKVASPLYWPVDLHVLHNPSHRRALEPMVLYVKRRPQIRTQSLIAVSHSQPMVSLSAAMVTTPTASELTAAENTHVRFAVVDSEISTALVSNGEVQQQIAQHLSLLQLAGGGEVSGSGEQRTLAVASIKLLLRFYESHHRRYLIERDSDDDDDNASQFSVSDSDSQSAAHSALTPAKSQSPRNTQQRHNRDCSAGGLTVYEREYLETIRVQLEQHIVRSIQSEIRLGADAASDNETIRYALTSYLSFEKQQQRRQQQQSVAATNGLLSVTQQLLNARKQRTANIGQQQQSLRPPITTLGAFLEYFELPAASELTDIIAESVAEAAAMWRRQPFTSDSQSPSSTPMMLLPFLAKRLPSTPVNVLFALLQSTASNQIVY